MLPSDSEIFRAQTAKKQFLIELRNLMKKYQVRIQKHDAFQMEVVKKGFYFTFSGCDFNIEIDYLVDDDLSEEEN
jgi:hypothetical protein